MKKKLSSANKKRGDDAGKFEEKYKELLAQLQRNESTIAMLEAQIEQYQEDQGDVSFYHNSGSENPGPETIYSCDQVTWIIHSGGFLIIPPDMPEGMLISPADRL
jgi:hypothetical protein